MIVEAPPRIMIRSPLQIFASRRHHNQWLVLIASYKLLQALLLFPLGWARDICFIRMSATSSLPWPTTCASIPSPAWSTFFSTKPNCSTIPSCAASAWSPSAIRHQHDRGDRPLLRESLGRVYDSRHYRLVSPLGDLRIARRLTLIRVSLLGANLLVFFYLLQLVADRAKSRRKERHTS